MPPTQEQEIPTSAGMETATQTVDRINQTRAASGNVNMSELATQGESLTMPTPAPINADVRGTLSAGQEAVEAFSAQEQARAAQAGQQYSASEQRLREQFGILGTQADTRQQLEGQAGVERFSQDLQKFQQQLRRQMADLDQFDVDNVNTIEAMRVDASKRDITKRTFNAMSAEAGIQNAVQRANKVAATRATIAAVDITQGNLTAATQQVDKALNAIYEPIRMGIQMESQFLQNNLSLFTTAQGNAANARLSAMEQEVAEIDRAQEMVNAAVASGGASAEQVEAMVKETDITKQTQMAMKIVASVNSADRALDRAYKQMQVANIQDQIRDRNAVDVETQKPLTQAQYTALGYAERVVDSSSIIDRIGDQFASSWSIGGILPNAMKSDERQMFEQAQRNFVNAVLRRESGAAIAESEFESAAKQYFPQRGDNPGVLQQKKVNRETVARNLLREGGQDTTPQDNTINDPLGLGINTTPQNNDPLGLTAQSTTSTK